MVTRTTNEQVISQIAKSFFIKKLSTTFMANRVFSKNKAINAKQLLW
jgi:hypothetical protein